MTDQTSDPQETADKVSGASDTTPLDRLTALEARVEALEAVVHAITPPNHLAAGGHVGEWLHRVGHRLANSL